MNRLFLVVAAAAVFSVAYAVGINWRIAKGSRAADGQFPYQVSLQNERGHFCGGSILNKHWVLTAAHCVDRDNASSMTVLTGTNKLDSGGHSYKVERIIAHKGFNMDHLHNDVALVKIKGKISFGRKVEPIALQTGDVNAGEKLVFSGWGLIYYTKNIPNDLQFLYLQAISLKECKARYKNFIVSVDKTQICTLSKSKGAGPTNGDSGGPLARKGKLMGIMSWSRSLRYPAVYTKVSSFVSWINKNMK